MNLSHPDSLVEWLSCLHAGNVFVVPENIEDHFDDDAVLQKTLRDDFYYEFVVGFA